MAIEEMREVQMPLDTDEGATDTSTNDTDDGTGDDGEGQAAQPDRSQSAQRAKDGKFQPKGGRQVRRENFGAQRQFSEEVGGLKAQLAAQAKQTADFQKELLEIRRAATQPQQRQAGPAGPTPATQRIETLEQALEAEVAAARAHDHKTGPYDLKRYNKIKRDLDVAVQEQTIANYLKQRGIDPDARPNPNAQRPMSRDEMVQASADTLRRETILGETPWLKETSHPEFKQRFDAFTATILYLESRGRPRGVATDREAAAMVAREFRIQPPRGAATPPRAPLTDNYRGGGRGDSGGALEVPSSMLEGVSPEMARRVAARIGRNRE